METSRGAGGGGGGRNAVVVPEDVEANNSGARAAMSTVDRSAGSLAAEQRNVPTRGPHTPIGPSKYRWKSNIVDWCVDSAGEEERETLHEHATDGGNSIGADSRDGVVEGEKVGGNEVGGDGGVGAETANIALIEGNKAGADRSSMRCLDLRCTARIRINR
jgi:hypothetical protein